MIRINNLDRVKASLRGYIDGLNRLGFTSDIVKEVQENVRDTPNVSNNRNEALKQSAYQSHLKHDKRGMENAIKNLPVEDRKREKVENDLIDKYIMDYLNQLFSEV